MELSTLCDAEIALLVFSASGKLFDYASTSTRQVIARRNLYSDVSLLNTYQPLLEFQVEGEYFKLDKELREKTRELRQLNGEELQGLTIKDLKKLEDLLSTCLHRVSKAKAEAMKQDISILKKEVQRLEQDQDQSLSTSLTTRLLFT
ncbi:MADS-box protein JOINTLESS-like [Neltuma alba]|nr:MADS-box protein JOINTLESS-like [Prosopis alba]